jgi:hypothetical protein
VTSFERNYLHLRLRWQEHTELVKGRLVFAAAHLFDLEASFADHQLFFFLH